jgi:sterol desaturase/sphingolipid hydroxylase (fatty acid hydroxylase superfamily)
MNSNRAMNLIHLAIPVFFLLILVERVAAHVLERDVYRLSDTLSDLACGTIDQIVGVFLKTVLFAGYIYLYEQHRFFSVPTSSLAGWLVCFLGVDFFYYWFHRWSHEVNAGWAAHVVHHQSEEMNLAVALRQSAFQQGFSWVFYLPLALLGFPPLMFLTLSSINTLYQFWIHTRLIGKLGPIEWIFNTPSHHRVHHARNPRYIDKNHAGTLIVWDRLFGTFVEEREECVYGVTTPLASWNPVWANFHVWADLLTKARRTARLSDRIRIFLRPPGWQPADLGGFVPAPEVDPATYRKHEGSAPAALRVYVLVQFVVAIVASTVFLFESDAWSVTLRVAGALGLVATLTALGGLLDGRGWALRLEAVRLVLLVGLGPFARATWLSALAFLLASTSLIWLVRHWRLAARGKDLPQVA